MVLAQSQVPRIIITHTDTTPPPLNPVTSLLHQDLSLWLTASAMVPTDGAIKYKDRQLLRYPSEIKRLRRKTSFGIEYGNSSLPPEQKALTNLRPERFGSVQFGSVRPNQIGLCQVSMFNMSEEDVNKTILSKHLKYVEAR